MIFKIVTLFLAFIAVLAMFGRWRFPKRPRIPKVTSLRKARCPDCGRFRIGSGPCPCGKGTG